MRCVMCVHYSCNTLLYSTYLITHSVYTVVCYIRICNVLTLIKSVNNKNNNKNNTNSPNTSTTFRAELNTKVTLGANPNVKPLY